MDHHGLSSLSSSYSSAAVAAITTTAIAVAVANDCQIGGKCCLTCETAFCFIIHNLNVIPFVENTAVFYKNNYMFFRQNQRICIKKVLIMCLQKLYDMIK